MRRAFLLASLLILVHFPSFALEPDQVYAKVAPSVVIVVSYDAAADKFVSLGSGVVVAPGQVITNCHVIKNADVIYLNREEYATVGIVRYSDPDRDLCQIGATDQRGFERPVSRISSTKELKVGQKVYAIGAPQGLVLTLSDGLISSLRKFEDETVIQTTAPISQGSSGGGLFNADGKLIGITTFLRKDGQNLNFAVPATWIGELATRSGKREESERLKLEEESRKLAELERAEEERRIQGEKEERERQTQEAIRREREAAELKAQADAVGGMEQLRLINSSRARIQDAIRSRVVLPPNIEGNPEARYEVVLLPGGEVFSATLKKSSGNSDYDAAIERAINRASPLPVPYDFDTFHKHFREFVLVFRPKD
jgi:TonB family protein